MQQGVQCVLVGTEEEEKKMMKKKRRRRRRIQISMYRV
jgi:hypothetical protein